jgi:hypothetical protein
MLFNEGKEVSSVYRVAEYYFFLGGEELFQCAFGVSFAELQAEGKNLEPRTHT